MRVVTISANRQPVKAICCPGTDATGCGTLLTRPGKCAWCGRVLTQAERDAAIAVASETRSEAA